MRRSSGEGASSRDGVGGQSKDGIERTPELPDSPFQGMKGPRKVWVAAFFWLVGGWFGLHRLYLGDEAGARGMLLTFGWCFVGWFRDGFRLRALVEAANNKQAGEDRTREIRPLSKQCAAAHCKNRVSNTKYGATTAEMFVKFLPLNLLEQLERNTNRYFLFIAILQLDPGLTPTHPLTTWGPLGVIFGFTALRELADDRARYLMDREANRRQYAVARDGRFVAAASEDIAVGDIVMLRGDQEVPCDMLLLASSLPEGSTFINTANLDGEGDLKLRRALPQTSALGLEADPTLAASLRLQVPVLAPHTLSGMLQTNGEQLPVRIGEQQALLQGGQVMNTEWVCGLCVYSGNETRLGRSRRPPSTKRSEVDETIDVISAIVFIGQAMLALMLGFMGNAWVSQHRHLDWYLRLDAHKKGSWQAELYQEAVIPLRFLLLMSTMIPLSIQVTMDTCKWLYSMWVGWDVGMTRKGDGEGSGETAHMRNSDVAENLGQVGILLTDKTGTLTENVMALKACSIAGRIYGDPSSETDGGKVDQDESLRQAVWNRDAGVLAFLRVLAVCNSVTTVSESIDGGSKPRVRYEACSPDEDALVKAAAGCGVGLSRRTADNVEISMAGQPFKYRILREMEFNSDRKRMSLVVEEEGSGDLLLLCKGADETLRPLLAAGQDRLDLETAEHVDEFSRLGLRVLLVCWKRLDRKEYEDWVKNELRVAMASPEGREQRIAQAYEKVECGLTLAGGTGIEDRLQAGVPQTMRSLREAGMKVWMVTGDKTSTALQIAISSGMLSSHTASHNTVVCSLPAQVESCIQQLAEAAAVRRGDSKTSDSHDEEGGAQLGVLVTGSCLESMNPAQKRRFVAGCLVADAVLCCRLTPDQKAELVGLVRESRCEQPSRQAASSRLCSLWNLVTTVTGSRGSASRVVASVGDGANDVAMIQEAHVGIGIVGREGSQAVRASDVSLVAFRDLGRLLQLHGSYSYQRSAIIAQLSFFKSWAFCLGQVLFAWFSGFGGTSMYDPFSIAACNALLFMPICFYALNRHVPNSAAIQRPALYRCGPGRHHLNTWSVWIWFARAVYQTVVTFGITFATLGAEHISGRGQPPCYTQVAAVSFSVFLIVQCCNLAFETHTFTTLQVLSLVLGLGGSFTLYALCNDSPKAEQLVDYYALFNAFNEPASLLLAMLVVVLCMIPVVTAKYWTSQYAPGPPEIGRQYGQSIRDNREREKHMRTPPRESGGMLPGALQQEQQTPLLREPADL